MPYYTPVGASASFDVQLSAGLKTSASASASASASTSTKVAAPAAPAPTLVFGLNPEQLAREVQRCGPAPKSTTSSDWPKWSTCVFLQGAAKQAAPAAKPAPMVKGDSRLTLATKPAATTPPPTKPPAKPAETGMSWTWMLAAAGVLGVGVYFLTRKKKKR